MKYKPTPTVNLDLLLHDNPTAEQIREEFKKDFPEEHYLISAIKRHLRTESDRQIIEQKDSSIEDMLNGRVANNDG